MSALREGSGYSPEHDKLKKLTSCARPSAIDRICSDRGLSEGWPYNFHPRRPLLAVAVNTGSLELFLSRDTRRRGGSNDGIIALLSMLYHYKGYKRSARVSFCGRVRVSDEGNAWERMKRGMETSTQARDTYVSRFARLFLIKSSQLSKESLRERGGEGEDKKKR